MAIRSVTEFSIVNQVAAIRFAKTMDDIATDYDFARRTLAEPPALADAGAKARKAQYWALRRLGQILADEDLVEGDEVVVDRFRYGLEKTGVANKYLGGEIIEVDTFVAVPLGQAYCPEDDSDDDELSREAWISEIRADYNRSVLPS